MQSETTENFDNMWSAPTDRMDAFITLSRQTTLVLGIGLSGRVSASGKPIWIPDVGADENIPRAPASPLYNPSSTERKFLNVRASVEGHYPAQREK
jgi:hypothetical protein